MNGLNIEGDDNDDKTTNQQAMPLHSRDLSVNNIKISSPILSNRQSGLNDHDEELQSGLESKIIPQRSQIFQKSSTKKKDNINDEEVLGDLTSDSD